MVTPAWCWISGFSCSNKQHSCKSEPLHSVMYANQNMTGSASKRFWLLFGKSKGLSCFVTIYRTYRLSNKGCYHIHARFSTIRILWRFWSFRKWFAIILFAIQKMKWWWRIDWFTMRIFRISLRDKRYSSCFADAFIFFVAWGDQVTFIAG